MATWPKKRRVLGSKVSRLDGPAKATGTAEYTFDVSRPGMLHAKILRCPYAHAKLTSLDHAAAEKMPGVQAIHVFAKPGREFYYAGEEVLALAADTEEHALDALHAVKAQYEELPYIVREQDGLNSDQKTVGGGGTSNKIGAGKDAKGDVDAAFQKADAVVEGVYGIPVIAHQCLESHGFVCEWDKEGNLTVWASTQAVSRPTLPNQFAGAMKIPVEKVKVICH
ncbi:MAG TPA: molybdopterin cofactor-binding domain-containing protein, partial [Gemmataceae bacterium]|nr:molybdopterin cofactor-binding domain-containing protein [Gemmataceae bacterium]